MDRIASGGHDDLFGHACGFAATALALPAV